ncbi:efflux RND transporter periplasmic adaptor subunit [Marinomonas atlantica]|uniref:efflux RND transporter periplasmic adaptor subunit n=1 Tax=Marinomonas atlantica TaxID=1806668 RepID=UPI0008324C92|nr:efflux RND transporter periplasmic adaptor subunit [Marinomonas atlantica]MCO4784601.1 efflux RND transporter periplasmic adaptor subunit [Marinomonas atlantica]
MTSKLKQGPILAVGIAVIAITWMFIGGHGITHAQSSQVNESQTNQNTPDNEPIKSATSSPFKVQTQISNAQTIQDALQLSGQTEANHTLSITAQSSGRVTSVNAKQGDTIQSGANLITIDDRALRSKIQYAEALIKQNTLELEGIKRLTSQKLTSDVSVASAETKLANAKANLTSLQIDLENHHISAPFSGFINNMSIQTGQWLNAGELVAEVIDLSPLKITANVPQIDLANISLDRPVAIEINGGHRVMGNIQFISKLADSRTRTFPIEIEIPNLDSSISAGLSTTIQIPLSEALAHKLSPALLSISEDGQMSVKTVSDNNLVEVHEVVVVRSERSHVYVKGLPDTVKLITTGQGFVNAGDKVEVQPVEDNDKS